MDSSLGGACVCVLEDGIEGGSCVVSWFRGGQTTDEWVGVGLQFKAIRLFGEGVVCLFLGNRRYRGTSGV